MLNIPAQGVDREEVFAALQAAHAQDLDPRGGRTWAYVYDTGRPDIEAVAKHAYMEYLSENGLDPTVFPSLLKFENEVVAMCAAHLGGDAETAGSFTSGGTESCMLAVKTAREHARVTRGITEPEIVIPVTGHAAFHKGASYMGVKVVTTPVDPVTFKADPAAIEAAITPNTVLVVCSAVSYAHGCVDPVPEIAALAKKHGVLCHVDGCIGGFLLPYFRRLGDTHLTPFDFSVEGVTSISMDLHKYAFCPKGASVLLHRNRDLRRHQYYACAGWTGYSIVNATIQSSKSGGPLAAAWAVLNYIGDDGYLELARQTREASRQVIEGLGKIRDIHILGTPELCLVAFASDTVNVFHVADEMKQRGWYVQPQLGFHGSKENVHLSVMPSSLGKVEAMLADLADSVEAAKALPPGQLAAAMGETLGALDPQSLDPAMFASLMGAAGISGDALPDRLAEINELLNALPPAITEQLLIAFLNELFMYRE
jgi:glutamate/tyrosine decarboxylase-like PLP-dependent enzyme